MKEPGERCFWLALLAALPLGTTLSQVLELSLLTSLVVGLGAMVMWGGAALALWSWLYVRDLHAETRHWVLTFVAIGMPEHYVPVWLEQMQAQLNELSGQRRKTFLTDLFLTAPKNWVELSWTRFRYLRASRFRGNELRLAQHLVMVLAPDGRRSTTFDLLHAVGISRLQNRRAAHNVPALVMAQRLLATESKHFRAARELAAELLDTRERVYLLNRDVLRMHRRVWPRHEQPPHSLRFEELDRLRSHALDLSRRLRAALMTGMARELDG
ncbi:hypothetical protein AB0A63_40470 [Lentzea sp. NPDC042327]|uniref:hypothetical protein n=1 Tax=Lentzea sp. NPDC042327 TaxID=3154801 RepID=UPI003403CBB7